MEEVARKLSDRLLVYGSAIVKLSAPLSRTAAGRHMSSQLLRSGTSAGANYEEACGAHSRADFIHKMQIVYKEIRESLYWLKLIQRSGPLPGENLAGLIEETTALSNIVGKSLITAKSKIPKVP